MQLTISHRGVLYPIETIPDELLVVFQLRLEELTGVPPSLQKLLFKGKRANVHSEGATLDQAGIKDGMKIQLLGSTEAELIDMRKAENEKRRKEDVIKQRSSMNLPKPRSTSRPSASSNFKFHEVVPLPHLPSPTTAHSLLTKLANDPAILHVMQKHEFSVGVLTELAPHEQPHLLGLNVNRGQAIKLRLRTDAYDGFRLYSDIKRVLCHELAHNIWGDHDNNFKALNSLLNKEVTDFEREQRNGAHTLSGSGPVYTPSASAHNLELDSEAQAYILGGSSSTLIGSREERRRMALEAAIRRIRREEEELEHSCGTAGPHQD